MIKIKPIRPDARSLDIDVPHLRLQAVVSADGSIKASVVKVRNPRTPSAEVIRIAEINASICEQCDHCLEVRRSVNGFAVYAVKCDRCKACGDGRISLIHGRCDLDKWHKADQPSQSSTDD